MAAWHRARRADLGLRALGIGLCMAACAAIAHLIALRGLPQSTGVIACGFATLGFVAASSGSALVIFGTHLFDEVEVSARWQHHRPYPDTEDRLT